MTEYYDSLEIRKPTVRQAEQIKAVADQVAHAQATCPAYQAILAGVDPVQLDSAAAIASLPVTRKSELIDRQRQDLPFGGMVSQSAAPLNYIFTSPGPIYEPGFVVNDYWHFARALYAAGLRQGHRVMNCFSYHFTPAGAMFDSAARALGCTVIPAGIGNTDMQAQCLHNLRPDAYVGTPSFLRIILEKADAMGLDNSSLSYAAVGGEPLFPPLQDWFRERGIQVRQGYATADIGSIAYETRPHEGMVIDEHIYLEIVRPGTGERVPEGEVGEILVTNFNPHYPLIRLATGDMSALMSGTSPCGRTNFRIKGWMGRADQTTKVRGMFVRPQQVADLVTKHPEISKVRVTVSQVDARDIMLVQCETVQPSEQLRQYITTSVRNVLHLRGDVELVGKCSLPNDGKVIDDQRRLD